MSDQQNSHESVLLAEVLTALAPLENSKIVDGTFGAGGYTRAMLNAGADVVGIDRDPTVQPFVDAITEDFGAKFRFVAGRFAELDQLVGEPVDGVVLDIGVSSMQLDQGERGFSFMRSGPLDMRMSRSGDSAADLCNELSEAELANLIFAYGEDKASWRIAKAIVAARAEEPLSDTLQLATLIEKTIGRKPGGPHPATRTFQALRIAVNGEFDELVQGMFAAERLLNDGGRLAVVTFHSLEDRIVKRFFDAEKVQGSQSRHMPITSALELRWKPVRKQIRASDEELGRNPRSRSATLRSAVRTKSPARETAYEGLGVPGFKRGGK